MELTRGGHSALRTSQLLNNFSTNSSVDIYSRVLVETFFTILGEDSCTWCSNCCISKLKYYWHNVVWNLEHCGISQRWSWDLRSLRMWRHAPDVSRLLPCLVPVIQCGGIKSYKNGYLNTEFICTRNVLSVCVSVVPLYLLTSIIVDYYVTSYLNPFHSVFDKWLSRNVASVQWSVSAQHTMCPDHSNSLPLTKAVAVFRCGILDTIVMATNKEQRLAHYKMRVGPKIVLPSSLSICWFVRLLHLVSTLHRSGLQQVHLWELGSGEPYWLPDRLAIKCAASYSFLVPLPSA